MAENRKVRPPLPAMTNPCDLLRRRVEDSRDMRPRRHVVSREMRYRYDLIQLWDQRLQKFKA